VSTQNPKEILCLLRSESVLFAIFLSAISFGTYLPAPPDPWLTRLSMALPPPAPRYKLLV
jgi:hypothetical protein